MSFESLQIGNLVPRKIGSNHRSGMAPELAVHGKNSSTQQWTQSDFPVPDSKIFETQREDSLDILGFACDDDFLGEHFRPESVANGSVIVKSSFHQSVLFGCRHSFEEIVEAEYLVLERIHLLQRFASVFELESPPSEVKSDPTIGYGRHAGQGDDCQ